MRKIIRAGRRESRAVAQALAAVDSFAVDKRSVAAAGVADEVGSQFAFDPRVRARDRGMIDDDLAVVAAADRGATVERRAAALAGEFENQAGHCFVRFKARARCPCTSYDLAFSLERETSSRRLESYRSFEVFAA
jgi:alkylhydroperoxidase family enzyme